MKRTSYLILAAILVLTSAPFAPAQREPRKPDTARFGDPTQLPRLYEDFIYGVIKKIDKNEMVLEKTKFGVDQTIKFDRKTKYLDDGKPAKWEDLEAGEQVWVDVKEEKKTGEMIAKKVLTGVAFGPSAE
jgi:hypothetical protein